MGTLPKTKYFSIQDAAKYLGVSTKTLRRWEESKKLSPVRTKGGHRRYVLTDLTQFTEKKKINPRKVYVKHLVKETPKVNPIKTYNYNYSQPTVKVQDVELYQSFKLHPEQRKVIKIITYSFFSLLFLGFVYKNSNSLNNLLAGFQSITTSYANELPLPGIAKTFINSRVENSPQVQGVAQGRAQNVQVLAAETTATVPVFNVNVVSSFKELANFVKGLTSTDVATGTLEATGAATFGSTINVTGVATLKNNLSVAGDITNIKGVNYSFPSAQGAAATVLKNDGAGTLTWGTITLPTALTDLTGVLPISQGGTNNSTSYTAGSVIFSDGSKLTQNNANFFWDDSNKRLGLGGTTAPNETLDVEGRVYLASTTIPSTTTNRLYNNAGTLYWDSASVCTSTNSCSATGTVGGSGTTNTIPKFTASTTVGDSLLTDNGTTLSYNSAFSVTSTGGISGITSVGLTLGSDATGDVYYRNSGGNLARLGIGSSGQVLSVTGGLPSWAGGSGGTGSVGFWDRSGTTLTPTNAGDTVGTTGKIGAGTTTPGSTLDVQGTVSSNASQLANYAVTNGNTGAGVTVYGLNINGVGSTPLSGTNTTNLIQIGATALGSNTFNGINFGSGLTNYINNTSWVVTAAGAETLGSSLTSVGVNSQSGLIQGTGGLTLTGTTNINASGSSVTNVATGTGNLALGNTTGTLSIASNGGLNVTTGGALTGVASIDTIATSATALTFAAGGTIKSTTSSALTLDSGTTGDVNLGTGSSAKTINIGTGVTGNTINIGASSSTTVTFAGIASGTGNALCLSGTTLVTCTVGSGGISGSGTPGRLSKFTTSSAIGDSLVSESGTTLGLNTTTAISGTSVTAVDFGAATLTFNGAGAVKTTTTNALTLDTGTTGTINIGTGTSGKTINLGTDNSIADTINIASALDTTTITGILKINLGSDATGDVYYRNSSGNFTRLGIGSSGQSLTVSGGLPVWAGGTGGTGDSGFWTRTGTTLSPVNSGDNITTTGNISTTSSGAITSAALLTASNGFTLTTGALNLTATSGSEAITGYGTSSKTSTTTTGNINTFADSSLAPAAAATANLVNLTFTNGSTNTSGTSTTTGLNIAPTNNAAGASGTMNNYGIRIQDIAGTLGAGTQNSYGIRIGNQGQTPTGTATSYGLYVDSQTGSTNSYSAIFAGGNVGISNLTPTRTLDVTGTGAFSSTLTAANGFTLTTGALNMTSTSGTSSLTSTATSGDSFAFTNTSLNTAGANLGDFIVKNNNTASAGLSVNGVNVTATGSTPLSGTNTTNLINLAATALASNTFNGINFGSGLSNYVNGTNWVVTAAGAETIASNLAVNGGSITSTAATDSLFTGAANTTVNIGPASNVGSIVLSGGSADTGCTLDGTTGNLTCSGNVTGSSSGTAGFWTRTSTTLSPATANDVVSISSNDASNAVLALTSTAATPNAFTLTANSLTTGIGLSIPHTTSVIASGGSLARISSTSVDTGTTTGNLLDLSSTASTAGTQLLQTYSALTGGIGEKIVTNALTTGTAFIIPHTTSVIANGGSLARLSSSSVDTSTTTGTLLDLASTGSTAGTIFTLTNNTASFTGIGQAISETGQTSGTGLSITGGGANITAGGELVDLQMGAATVGNAINIVNSGAYTGTGLLNITANSLTTGTAINIPHTTSVIAAGGSLIRASSSSVDTSTTTGTLLDLASTGSTAGTIFTLTNNTASFTGIGQAISETGQTTGTGLKITGGGATLAAGGKLVDLQMGAATAGNGINILTSGSYAGTGLGVLTADSLTTGKVLAISSAATTGITTAGSNVGSLLDLTESGAMTLFTGSLASINASGANTSGATGNGLNINLAGTGQVMKAINISDASTGALTGGAFFANLTGAHTGTGFEIDDVTATGTVAKISDNALTTGIGLNVAHTTSVVADTGSLARISSTSVDTGGATNGVLLDLSSTGSTAGTQVLQTYSALSTGIGEKIVANALTTGTAFIIPHTTSVIANGGSLARLSSTSVDTSTTTGVLLDLSSTASTAGTQFLQTYSGLTTGIGQSIVSSSITTGDLLKINSSGTTLTSGFLLDLQNNSSSVFTVGANQITASIPAAFNAPGDVSVAYDLQFTNPTSSNIKSEAPLLVASGETFNNSNLTLRTYNLGNILLDSGSSSSGTGLVGVGPNVTPIALLHVSNTGESFPIGKALAIFDQSESQDLITASAAGVSKFAVTTAGIVNVAASGGLDTIAAGTLNLGTTNATTINFGKTGASSTAYIFQSATVNAAPTSLAANGAFAIGSIGGTAATNGRIWIRASNTNFRFNSDTQSLDYSEYLQQADTSEPGDVMVLSDTTYRTVKKSNGTYDQNALGVVTQYGTGYADGCIDDPSCGQSFDPHYANVGMLGQVYTKISTENGSILPGDPLTTSSIPGVAMKATKAGRIIGHALDSFDGITSGKDLFNLPIWPIHNISGRNVGKILILLQASWFDPSAPPPDSTDGLVFNQENDGSYGLTDATGKSWDNVFVAKDGAFANLRVGGLTVDKLTANSITANQINGLQPIVNQAVVSNATQHYSSSDLLSVGDIVSFDASSSGSVKKSLTGYDPNIVGIVISDPNQAPTDHTFPVISNGSVAVKIATDSGTISIGDYLTSSDTYPGQAMKATHNGEIIGRAMSGWTAGSTQSTIMVLAGVQYFGGTALTDLQNATDAASLSARITNLETDFSTFQSALTASSSGIIANLNEVNTSKLNVLGDAVLGDTVVNGKLNIGGLTIDNTNQSLNAIGVLKIQNLALGNIEFMNGLITFDTNGNVIAKSITADKYKVAGASAGADKIVAGQTSIFINSTQVTNNSLVFVTASTKTTKVLAVTEKHTGSGFKVEIPTTDTNDINFNWWIVDKQ